MPPDSQTKPPPVRWCTFWDTTETRYLVAKGKTLMMHKYPLGPDDSAWYIYAGDDKIAMIDKGGDVHYYLKDHLGTSRVTVRDDGVVTGRYYKYYAFGATESEQVSLNQEYKYTGKPMDEELNLDIYYYGARYYYPVLGRWIAVDPKRNKYPGWSPYGYCANNPIKYIDKFGLQHGSTHNDKLPNNETVGIEDIWYNVEKYVGPLLLGGTAISVGVTLSIGGFVTTSASFAFIPESGGLSLLGLLGGLPTLGGGLYLVSFGSNIYIIYINEVFGTNLWCPHRTLPQLFPKYPNFHDKHKKDNNDNNNDNDVEEDDDENDGQETQDPWFEGWGAEYPAPPSH